MRRRDFLATVAAVGAAPYARAAARPGRRPNIVYIMPDQWRAQATGYAGDPNVKTPNIDRLAGESINMTRAVANCPVCTPSRASLLTSQYPHEHGLFINDVPLDPRREAMGDVFKAAGYDTAWIGKWHVDGHGRASYIPPERRQGFDTWHTLECTHDYNRSAYYGDSPEIQYWKGYDAIEQTRAGCDFIRNRDGSRPFCLVFSWGPPHNPYETAPERFKALYDPASLVLRGNVPPEAEAIARKELAGYYAHCSALDACVGAIMDTLEDLGIDDDTILVFTSDHGDMLHSQGEQRKQRPWDESVLVPFLLRYPRRFGRKARQSDYPFATVDILPTLCALAEVAPPAEARGQDLSPVFRGDRATREDDAALIACYSPFGEWTRANGGREYRGLRTRRYTFVRTLEGPWLLFDNDNDPLQMNNLANLPDHAELQDRLEKLLTAKLEQIGDTFLPGNEYISQWQYQVDETGTASSAP